MVRPSKIDKLPSKVRQQINLLREKGCTIDEILDALKEFEISRSGLGRHLQKQGRLAERLQRSRQLAEALTQKFGDAEPGRAQILNIELMHAAIMQLSLDLENPDAKFETKDISMLAAAVAHLARASKDDLGFRQSVEKEMREKIQAETKIALEEAGKKCGISKEASKFLIKALAGESE